MLIWRVVGDADSRYLSEDALPGIDGLKPVCKLEGSIQAKGDISPEILYNRFTDCLTVLDGSRIGESHIH